MKKLVFSVMCVLVVGAMANAGLVSSWSFEEGSGTVAADSVGDNDMTLMNGALFDGTDPGAGVYSMEFDGADDYLAGNALSADLNPGTEDFTISFKVNVDVLERAFVLNKRNPEGGEWIAVEISSATGYVKLNVTDNDGGVGNVSVFNQTPLVVNTWYDVDIVVDRDAPVKIFVDGVDNTHSGYNNVVIGGDLTIASIWEMGRWSGGGYYLNGQLDDVSITVVPEPATIGLLALGGLLIRRKK